MVTRAECAVQVTPTARSVCGPWAAREGTAVPWDIHIAAGLLALASRRHRGAEQPLHTVGTTVWCLLLRGSAVVSAALTGVCPRQLFALD